MAEHARLAPSAADRWMVCAGSVQAVHGPYAKDSSNVYADLGRAAHKLLELCMLLEEDPDDYIGLSIDGHDIDEDMTSAVGTAIDYVNRYLIDHPNAKVVSEHIVSLERATGRRDLWGTLDIAIDNYQQDPDELVIIDYKHGQGVPVAVERNPQLMLYALGYRSNTRRTFARYRFVIVQPRIFRELIRVKEWECDNRTLNEFLAEVREAAAATDAPDAPRVAGDHCRWCPALTRCRAVSLRNMRTAMEDFTIMSEDPIKLKDPQDITPIERARLLNSLPMLQAWAAAFWTDSVIRIWRGEDIPGWKPVAGKTKRQWRQDLTPQEIIDAFLLFLGQDTVAPRKLAALTKLETAMKRAGRLEDWKQLSKDFVGRTLPPAHIAPEADPRPRANIAAQFAPIQGDQDGESTEES